MNRKVCKAIFSVISLGIMIVIFYFSAQEAVASQAISDGFITKILRLFMPNFNNLEQLEQLNIIESLSTLVRKMAHFCIYAALGFCLNGAAYNDYKISRKIRPFLVNGIGLLYALSDEIHQYFVPGRAMKIIDVLIDFCGLLCGSFILFVIYYLIKRGRTMDLNTTDIYELIKRDTGKIIYKGKKGIIASTNDKELVITTFKSLDDLKAILLKNNIHPDTFVVKDESLRDEILAAYSVERSLPCSQWVYTKMLPPLYKKSDIRTLGVDDIDIIMQHYKMVNDEAYLIDRLKSKMMFGIYDNNQLAGFIGVHSEGSIGMLEIFPEYRRRGYGYILEAFVIEKLLDLGYTPYCHVVEGNDPSYKLQEKLGYKKADKLSIWININKNPSN